MILIRHDKSFYSIHTERTTDGSMEEGLYYKCNQYGITEYELDRAIEDMNIKKNNAVHFDSNGRMVFTYTLGKE